MLLFVDVILPLVLPFFFLKKKLIPFIRYVKIFHTDLGSITGNLERAVILSTMQLGCEPLNIENCEVMALADCPFLLWRK